MKRGKGIKGLDDKSSGMEILIADAFAKINPTEEQNFSFLSTFFWAVFVQTDSRQRRGKHMAHLNRVKVA